MTHNTSNCEGSIYVGWSRQTITPDKPARLLGQMYERISQYIHSTLYITVMALETRSEDGSSSEQMIMGTCDLAYVSEELMDEIKGLIKYTLPDFDSDKLILNATHCHSAPDFDNKIGVSSARWLKYIPEEMQPKNEPATDEPGVMGVFEYRKFLINQIVLAVKSAWESREPGQISWRLGHAVIGHNRRMAYYDNTARMYGKSDSELFSGPEGPSDHGVELLYVWGSTGNLTGVVANVACPSQVLEHKYYISADYWGCAREIVEEKYGHDFMLLPLCGAAGDQSPRDMVRQNRGEPSMFDSEGAEELGKRVAATIFENTGKALQAKKSKVIFRHIALSLKLPVITVSEKERRSALTEFNSILEEINKSGKITPDDYRKFFLPGGILYRYDFQQQYPVYETPVHVLRLGDVAFFTNPFELFTDYGLQLKARSRGIQTFIAELSCGWGKYLPTKRAVAGGHYSAIIPNNLVGPEGGKILVDEAVSHINAFWSEENNNLTK